MNVLIYSMYCAVCNWKMVNVAGTAKWRCWRCQRTIKLSVREVRE
jgi:hypothetical protein